MNQPTLSVVLPTYNRGHCIARAIQSVLGQTYTDLELIVVDDNSTDDTAAAVAAFRDPRLHYVPSTERLGVSRARNLGAKNARGDWIAFQDSDDVWRSDKLARQLAAAADDVALILCGCTYVNRSSMSFPTFGAPDAIVDFGRQVGVRIPGAPCFVLPRRHFIDAGGFDTELNCFEDWELALRLADRGRILFINTPLVEARYTAGGLFSADSGYAHNLRRIVARHETRLRANHMAWAHYCNLIGQSECQYGSSREGRRWFREALAANPLAPRTWVNLAMSCLGGTVFRSYVRFARALHNRFAPLVRPALYTGPG